MTVANKIVTGAVRKQSKAGFTGLLIMMSFCFAMPSAFAQSLIFSQYYFSPSNLNPALAGLEKDLFFGVNHRSQWRDLQVPYNASLFTFSSPFFVTKPKVYHAGGVAFSVSQETAGSNQLYHSVRGQLSAAYNLRLDYENRNILAFGLQGGLVRNTIDDNHLQWGSQYNELMGYDPGIAPSLGQLNDRIIYPAFSSGIAWHHKAKEDYTHHNLNKRKYRGFLGLSFANLNRPNTAHFTAYTSRAPLIYTAHGGVEYQIRNIQLSHHALWIKANNTYHFNFGTYVTYFLKNAPHPDINSLSLLLGSWYRFQDAFVLSMGLKAKKFNTVVSYDFNKKVNAADNTLSGGAYEVSVSYRIPRKINNKQYGIPLM
jgi:type IX secretion system PorP/SprF family membrane protein